MYIYIYNIYAVHSILHILLYYIVCIALIFIIIHDSIVQPTMTNPNAEV